MGLLRLAVIRAIGASLFIGMFCLPCALGAQTASPSPSATESASASPAPSPTATATDGPIVLINGHLLVMQDGFVVLTTGDALRVDPQVQISGLAPLPGRFVLLHVDRSTKLVFAIEVALRPFAKGIPGADLPRRYVVVDPRSVRTVTASTTHGNGQTYSVTIEVEVPANTPSTDAVYFSSDRSNWSVSEARLDQIDGLHWSLTLPLLDGTTLHYKFTRGSYATIERDRAGADVPARTLIAHKGLKTADIVLRWADRQ